MVYSVSDFFVKTASGLDVSAVLRGKKLAYLYDHPFGVSVIRISKCCPRLFAKKRIQVCRRSSYPINDSAVTGPSLPLPALCAGKSQISLSQRSPRTFEKLVAYLPEK